MVKKKHKKKEKQQSLSCIWTCEKKKETDFENNIVLQ